MFQQYRQCYENNRPDVVRFKEGPTKWDYRNSKTRQPAFDTDIVRTEQCHCNSHYMRQTRVSFVEGTLAKSVTHQQRLFKETALQRDGYYDDTPNNVPTFVNTLNE